MVRLYINFFQPVMKLKHKSRHGAKVHKVYDTARTPYRRLVDRNVLDADQLATLAQAYDRLNPVTLRARIDQALGRLWTLADNP